METQVQGSGNDGGGVVVATAAADWSDDVREIGDAIANLTLLQCVQLHNYLKEVHGVEPSGGSKPNPDIKPPETTVEQTEWAVVYDGFDPTQKINAIKLFREVSGTALKEAKDFIEGGAGKTIKEGLSREEAEALKTKFEAAGAKITLK